MHREAADIAFHFGLDLASGPDICVRAVLVNGRFYVVPDYIRDEWLDRITVIVDAKGVHWCWTGWNNGEGHGKARIDGRVQYVYRHLVEQKIGRPLLKGEVVDHVCERKPCITLEHLDPCTTGTNTSRGPGAFTQYRSPEDYI